MNTQHLEPRAFVSPAERQRWVRRYREGSLGLRRFAEVHGLRPTQLHYWIYGHRPATARSSADGEHGPVPIFREVEVLRSSPDSGASWDAELDLTNGTRLRVRRDADPAWIVALAQGLNRPC